MPGKPTRLAPIPKPAPDLAEAPMLGRYVSKILNVIIAVKAISRHSSMFRLRCGITYAAIATKRPSIKYFSMRLDNSPTSNIFLYYLKNSHYIAAINRFETVVKEYPTTSHTPEALHRLVEAYLSLGLEGEATVAAAILGHNFKSSLWYQESYNLLGNQDINPNLTGFRGWLGDIYRQVIRGEWI